MSIKLSDKILLFIKKAVMPEININELREDNLLDIIGCAQDHVQVLSNIPEEKINEEESLLPSNYEDIIDEFLFLDEIVLDNANERLNELN